MSTVEEVLEEIANRELERTEEERAAWLAHCERYKNGAALTAKSDWRRRNPHRLHHA